MQDDFSSYLFTTSAARWTPGVVFTLVDEPNYKIDSWVFSLGNDWQYNEKLKLAGSYTYTRSKGDVASGTVFTQLQAATGTIDSIIDNSLHSVSLSADYSLSEKATLRVNYIFDYYDDNAYDLLTNGANTLAIGVSYAM
jgi:predicted porin